jgi:hypothetical protein
MALDLANYEKMAKKAVQAFWGNRAAAAQKQKEAGKTDQGGRAGVTAGKNMDGFIALIVDLIEKNGLADAEIHQRRKVLTLPGFFRPTKLWDIIVTRQSKLIAAIELKSQVGPSFGNNFNNRTEEAIGTGHDFWTAYREDAFGQQTKPFIGWLMLVEDEPKSRAAVDNKEPHFPVFPEFAGASYLQRYEILCQRMMKEQLYTAACLITATKESRKEGAYSEMSEMTGLKSFVAAFAAHVAGEAARG